MNLSSGNLRDRLPGIRRPRSSSRPGGATSSPAKLVADELCVGYTWSDVTSPGRPQLVEHGFAPAGIGIRAEFPLAPMKLESATQVAGAGTAVGLATKYRWFICALLFFATTVNYVDRQILALIKSSLDAALGWSNEQFGRVNAAFQGAYGLGLLGFGWFVDRVGTKIGYAVS